MKPSVEFSNPLTYHYNGRKFTRHVEPDGCVRVEVDGCVIFGGMVNDPSDSSILIAAAHAYCVGHEMGVKHGAKGARADVMRALGANNIVIALDESLRNG